MYFLTIADPKYGRDIWLCADSQIPACHPDRWIFECKIRTQHGIQSITCRIDPREKAWACRPTYLFNSNGLMCCSPRCPT